MSFKGFKEGQVISANVLIEEIIKSKTRSGNDFLKLIINDGQSTSIEAYVWEEDIYDFKVGETIKLTAKVSSFNGKTKLDAISAEATDKKVKLKLPSLKKEEFDDYKKKLESLKSTITDNDYLNFLNIILADEILEQFFEAPAAKEHHQAFVGGLLQHTVNVAQICLEMYKLDSKNVNLSLLLCGAILHDIGKIKSYNYETKIERSTPGMLIEHICLGLMILDRLKPEDFPITKFYHLCHLIVSHHGKREWGSPVEPMMKEAIILHNADMMDSYNSRFDDLAEKNANKEWSEFDESYKRKWYLKSK